MAGAANVAPTARARALFFIPPLLPCFAVSLCGTTRFHTHDFGASYARALIAVNNERRDCVVRATLMRRGKRAVRGDRSATVLFELVALRLERAAKLARHAGLWQG